MYFWKCWRDSRTRFIVAVIVIVAVCGLFTVPAARLGTPGLMEAHVHPSIAQSWSAATWMVLGLWGTLMVLIWGLVLGSKGLGKEFDEGTAYFLFTRPCGRRYWVWAGWPVGVLELTLIVLAAVGATCGVLVYSTGHFYSWRPLATIPGLAVGGAVAYSLTYFMTVVTRSGRQGLSYAIGILVIAILLPGLTGPYSKIHMPSLWDFMTATCSWSAGVAHSYPFWGLMGWAAIALAFPLAAQAFVVRAEA
jgi:ABC-type transport system involved in multi-copper enzyme maturation permease subunit